MRARRPSPPALLRRLLERLLPADLREFVTGDMEEGFRTRARRDGLGSARLWYLRQALRSLRDTRGASRAGRPRDRNPGLLDRLRQDIRGACRSLRRAPGFSALTVLTLGLGLGATVGIFAVLHGVVLSPLPYPESDDLVVPTFRAPGVGVRSLSTSEPMYVHLRKRSRTLEEVAVWETTAVNLSGAEGSVRVRSIRVSGTFFEVLGVPPARGRPIRPQDARPGAPAVAILSHGLWQRRFGGDPEIVGRTLPVAGRTTEVVGVMPAGFAFPRDGIDVLMPLEIDIVNPEHREYYLHTLGRLTPEATLDDFRAEIGRLMMEMPQAYPGEGYEFIGREEVGFRADGITLKEDLVGYVDEELVLLLVSVFLLLLVAGANVANLFLVRAEGRQREMSIRTAMGAGRARMVRHVLGESLLLALAAGVFGLAVAGVGIHLLLAWNPIYLPRTEEVGLTPAVIAFTSAVSVVAGIVFALYPALKAARGRPSEALRDGRASTASPKRFRSRSFLVAGQVALALVLLSGSALLARSFQNLRETEPGFESEGVLTFRLFLDPISYGVPAEATDFLQRLLERVRGLPGVESAGAVTDLPLAPGGSERSLVPADDPPGDDEVIPAIPYRFVTDGYFETLGIRVVRGRGLERADIVSRRPVAVVDRTLARRFWPDRDPIGARIGPDEEHSFRVVGVVEAIRDVDLSEDPKEMAYFPVLGPPELPSWDETAISVAVRAPGAEASLVPTIRRLVGEMDPTVAIADVRSMEELMADDMAETSFLMLLLGLAAVLSLVLGGVGLFGVISYVVAQRRREIGVRIALGAPAAMVRRMVLRQSLTMAAAGTVAGALGVVAAGRFLESFLFGMSAHDPVTLGVSAMFILAVAAVAAWIPARRAAGTNPIDALRAE